VSHCPCRERPRRLGGKAKRLEVCGVHGLKRKAGAVKSLSLFVKTVKVGSKVERLSG
jgi:hypothetical protein